MIRGAMTYAWVMLGLAIGGAGVARATDFDFSYTANGVSVMGIFNTTSEGGGRYLITGITNGTRGGIPISLLGTNSPLISDRNDNILYVPQSANAYLDGGGFGFTTGAGNYDTYFQNSIGYNEAHYDTPGSGETATFTDFQVTLAPVPAPIPGGGLLSFLALGVAGLAWRRRAIAAFGRELRARRAV